MSAFKRSVPLALAGAAVAAGRPGRGEALAGQQAPPRPAALTQHSALTSADRAAQDSAASAEAVPRGSRAKGGWTISRGGTVVAVAVAAVVKDTTAGKTAPCYLSTMRLSLKSGRSWRAATSAR